MHVSYLSHSNFFTPQNEKLKILSSNSTHKNVHIKYTVFCMDESLALRSPSNFSVMIRELMNCGLLRKAGETSNLVKEAMSP